MPHNRGTGAGQNQRFIGGIHGTQLTGPATLVFIDGNGRLGSLTAPVAAGTGTVVPSAGPEQVREKLAALERLDAVQHQLVREQQGPLGRVRERLARLEAATVRKQ